MNARLWLAGFAALAAIGGALTWALRPRAPHFVTAVVARGDIARAIVTTGSVNPVVTVQVGTYVSGPIQSLSCDFNTEVRAGQECAKIDPRTYQDALDQAQAALGTAGAQLHKDQASLRYAEVEYERDRGLLGDGVVSQDALDADKSAYDQAQALVNVDRAAIDERRAELETARINLQYTDIVSPVNGTVVARNVDVGQTVAASFQTPTLFLIAQDLTKMQVDTNVSESDVGGVRVGQKATFAVEAYPDRVFQGDVVQVRQAPITVQNVVTYDVVIGVANPEHLLFPGMTANVRIRTDERADVTTVPTQALRFEPRLAAHRSGAAGSVGTARERHVWVLRQGEPVAVPVEVGLDDGTRSEIRDGALAPGERVIVDQVAPGGARVEAAQARAPFRF